MLQNFSCTQEDLYPCLIVHNQYPVPFQTELHLLTPDAVTLLQLQKSPHTVRWINNTGFLRDRERGQMLHHVCRLGTTHTATRCARWTTRSSIYVHLINLLIILIKSTKRFFGKFYNKCSTLGYTKRKENYNN